MKAFISFIITLLALAALVVNFDQPVRLQQETNLSAQMSLCAKWIIKRYS